MHFVGLYYIIMLQSTVQKKIQFLYISPISAAWRNFFQILPTIKKTFTERSSIYNDSAADSTHCSSWPIFHFPCLLMFTFRSAIVPDAPLTSCPKPASTHIHALTQHMPQDTALRGILYWNCHLQRNMRWHFRTFWPVMAATLFQT